MVGTLDRSSPFRWALWVALSARKCTRWVLRVAEVGTPGRCQFYSCLIFRIILLTFWSLPFSYFPLSFLSPLSLSSVIAALEKRTLGFGGCFLISAQIYFGASPTTLRKVAI